MLSQRAQALAQHHDAVTGTSRQHVADDYAQRLDAARAGVEGIVSAALSRAAFEGGDGGEGGLLLLQQCRLANVSTCDVTMEVRARPLFCLSYGVVHTPHPVPIRSGVFLDKTKKCQGKKYETLSRDLEPGCFERKRPMLRGLN